jgi:hypothetical protein
MAFGINKVCQIGRETVYGTIVPATQNLNYLSESVTLNVDKAVEDTLLASKAVNGFDITGYTVSGDINLILKPENAGMIFAWALGKEATVTLKPTTTGVYTHSLTGVLTTETLPSASITVDRGAAIKGYAGCQVDKLSISAKAKETLKATVSVKGQTEATDTIISLTNPSLASFRFIGGIVEFADSSYGQIDSIDWSYSNSLEDGFYTLTSGLYPERHEHGVKNCEVSINALYDATTEGIRENNYKAGAYLKVELTFESPAVIEGTEKHVIYITMLKVQITEASVNIGGKERIMMSIKGSATENAGSEPVTVVVYNTVSTKYFS